jgi:hypothetical protein
MTSELDLGCQGARTALFSVMTNESQERGVGDKFGELPIRVCDSNIRRTV